MKRKRENEISREDLQFDNEIRKAKMTIEQGAHFGGGEEIPPEVESVFLDNIENFEKQFHDCKQITVHQRLGKPSFRHVGEIPQNQIKDELERLMTTMEDHGLIAESIYEVDDMEMYRFITEDLFPDEIDDIKVPGMMTHFTYEEFHPNREGDAVERTRDFIKHILRDRDREKDDGEFFKDHLKMITGSSLYTDEYLNKIMLFRSFYEKFKINSVEITDLQMNDDKTQAEVFFKMDVTATLEDTTRAQTISGAGKATVEREDDWWHVLQFEMPGIKF